MAQQRPPEKINIVRKKAGNSAGQQRSRPHAEPEPELFTHEQLFATNDVVGYGNNLDRIPVPPSEMDILLDTDGYYAVQRRILQVEKDLVKQELKRQDRARAQNSKVNRHRIVPFVRTGFSNLHTDDQACHAIDVIHAQAAFSLNALKEAYFGRISLVDMAKSQQLALDVNRPIEQEIYHLANNREQARRLFDQELELKPTILGYDHALALKEHDTAAALEMAKLDASTRLEMAKLDAQERAAQRADTAIEADKQRGHDTVHEMTNLIWVLHDVEIQLQGQSQPTEMVIAALTVVREAMITFNEFFSEMDPAAKAAMAPMVQRVIKEAIEQAMRAIGGRRTPPAA